MDIKLKAGKLRVYFVYILLLACVVNVGVYLIVHLRRTTMNQYWSNFTSDHPASLQRMDFVGDILRNMSLPAAAENLNSSMTQGDRTPSVPQTRQSRKPNITTQIQRVETTDYHPQINNLTLFTNASNTSFLLAVTPGRNDRIPNSLQDSEFNGISNAQSHHTAHFVSNADPVRYITASPEFRRKHYMTISGQGRLGNQLFQFASLLGIAFRLGYSAFIPLHHGLNTIFEMDYAKTVDMINVRKVGERRCGEYDTRVETLNNSTNYTLLGYMQSWKYFNNVSDIIRKAYTFKSHIRKKVNTMFNDLRLGNRTTVGVHIRRGDMLTHYESKRGYQTASLEFINKAMEYFRKKLNNPMFIVVSDDKSWVSKNVRGPDVKLGVGNNAAEDLAILATCNHSVVTSGTYGWWGAWLAGGDTVYYRNYPSAGSWLEKQYNRQDYYPPQWVPME